MRAALVYESSLCTPEIVMHTSVPETIRKASLAEAETALGKQKKFVIWNAGMIAIPLPMDRRTQLQRTQRWTAPMRKAATRDSGGLIGFISIKCLIGLVVCFLSHCKK